MYGPCAARVKHKFASKKAYPRSYCYYRFFV